MLFTINSVVKRGLKKINSEITLEYFCLLSLLNIKFLAGVNLTQKLKITILAFQFNFNFG
jgi:hypothetical protein